MKLESKSTCFQHIHLDGIRSMKVDFFVFSWQFCMVDFSTLVIFPGHIRRFRNNCEIVEEPNSSGKNRIRVKFFSLLTQLFKLLQTKQGLGLQ